MTVVVSADGTQGVVNVSGTEVSLPVCVKEVVPEEIPCCVRRGVLYCPEHPDYHGLPVERARQAGLILTPCEEETPQEPPPPDCCVHLDADGSATLVCSDTTSPFHGYVLRGSEFECQETSQGMVCSVSLSGGRLQARLPVCPLPSPEPVPPDCCYDLAQGILTCPDDTSSEWHGLHVSLENLQSEGPGQPGVALVSHAKLGSTIHAFPVCEVRVPQDCCFEAADRQEGAVGTLRCPSSPALDGQKAVLTDLNEGPDGEPIASVSWAGGGARLPFCRPPSDEIPPERPPYFCCVSADTGLFVCPANPTRDGQPADIVEAIDHQGLPWVRLRDGQVVPVCGSSCPAPRPCPTCPESAPCPVPEPCLDGRPTRPPSDELPRPTRPPSDEPGPRPGSSSQGCPPCEDDCSQPTWGVFHAPPVGLVPYTAPCDPCC